MNDWWLVRHGKAEEARVAGLGGDRARRLTAEDEQRLRETLPGLRGLQVRPHRILSSPYPRAYPTAGLVARALLNSPEPEVCHPLDADQAVEPLWGACLPQGLSEGRNLMLAGHEPILSQLASTILVGEKVLLPIQVKKGGLVHLRVGVHSGQPKGFLLVLWSAVEIRRLCRE